jgi:hypothetical protein
MSRQGRAADLLLLGSAKDDWSMGRLAIQSFTAAQAQQIQYRGKGLQGFFEMLRPEWRRTLIDLIFFASYQKTRTSKGLFWDWSSVYHVSLKVGNVARKTKGRVSSST